MTADSDNPYELPLVETGDDNRSDPPACSRFAEMARRFFAAFGASILAGACWGWVVATYINTNPLDFWPAIIGYSFWSGLVGFAAGIVWALKAGR